jgi:hypothetical protein
MGESTVSVPPFNYLALQPNTMQQSIKIIAASKFAQRALERIEIPLAW